MQYPVNDPREILSLIFFFLPFLFFPWWMWPMTISNRSGLRSAVSSDDDGIGGSLARQQGWHIGYVRFGKKKKKGRWGKKIKKKW